MRSYATTSRDAFVESLSMPKLDKNGVLPEFSFAQGGSQYKNVSGFFKIETNALNDRLLEMRDQSREWMRGNPNDRVIDPFKTISQSAAAGKTQEDPSMKQGEVLKEQLVTYSAKGIWLWERGHLIKNVAMRAIETQILNIVYIPPLRIFLVACMDMTFRVYDRSLVKLQTIPHDEQAINFTHYLPQYDCFLLSGAEGMSLWTVARR